MSSFNTCRFCHKSQWEKGVRESMLVRYGTRHWAHLACLSERGRLIDVLTKMHTHQLNQLPALELLDLGVLNLVRKIVAARPSNPRTEREQLGL